MAEEKKPDKQDDKKQDDSTEVVELDNDDLEAIQHIIQSISGKDVDLVKEARKVGRNRDGDLVWIPSEKWRPLVEAVDSVEKSEKKPAVKKDGDSDTEDKQPEEKKEEAAADTGKADTPEPAKPKPAPKVRQYRRVDTPKKQTGKPQGDDYQSLVEQREQWAQSGETVSS